MKMYVIFEGDYEQRDAVAIVREQDMPTYMEKRFVELEQRADEHIASLNKLGGENAVAKVLSVTRFGVQEMNGYFGVRVEMLTGTSWLTKVEDRLSIEYSLIEVWEQGQGVPSPSS